MSAGFRHAAQIRLDFLHQSSRRSGHGGYQTGQVGEQHPYWHRRLELCAVARQLLSGGARAGARAGICKPASDRDRDQQHVPRHAEAHVVCELARCHARWLRLLGQGFALCDQSPRAGRRGRFDQPVHRQRHCRIARKTGPGRLAVRTDQAVRGRRFRGLPEPVADLGGGREAAARDGGASRELHVRRVPEAGAQVQGGHRLHRFTEVSVVR